MLFYSILPYVVSGAFAAIAITFSTAQLLSADPLAGNMMELDAIAAVVIGGACLFGGRGSIIGTLMGVLIMVMIRNGLNLLGVSPFWQGSAIGTIIIFALLVERLVLDPRRTLRGKAGIRWLHPLATSACTGPRRRSRRRACCAPAPLSAELDAGNLRHIRYRRGRGHPRRVLHRARPQLGHLQPRDRRPRRG